MKQKLQQTFIPSPHNEGTPLMLQAGGALTIMVLAFALFLLANVHGSIVKKYAGSNYAAVVAAILIDQSNEERVEQGLPALRPNPILTASAQLKADDMAENEYFAHNSPSGLSPWYWFKQAGYKFSFAGENLAVNFRNSSSVTRAWVKSPTHAANIFHDNYEEIGIATAVGRYKGRETTFVAQHFGTPFPEAQSEINILPDSEISTQSRAVSEANELLAAINNVSFSDRLLVQPQSLYLTLFGLLLFGTMSVAVNAYRKSESNKKQRHIFIYTVLIAATLVSLAIATTAMLDTEIIAGTLVSTTTI